MVEAIIYAAKWFVFGACMFFVLGALFVGVGQTLDNLATRCEFAAYDASEPLRRRIYKFGECFFGTLSFVWLFGSIAALVAFTVLMALQ